MIRARRGVNPRERVCRLTAARRTKNTGGRVSETGDLTHLSIVLELCGVRSLTFAVGSYLPIATTAPIFAGGLVRWWVERTTGKPQESDLSAGVLLSSGLIAGGSITGILFAVLVGTGTITPFQSIGNMVPFLHSDGVSGQIATALLFLALAVVVARTAMRKVE